MPAASRTLSGRLVAGAVALSWVLEHLDVQGDVCACLVVIALDPLLCMFPLLSLEEVLHRCVVMAVSYPAHVEDVEVVGFGGVVFLSSTTQVFGSDIATAMLADADGVPVRVTLCLDNHDQLFELELWKADFSPIIGVDLRGAFSEH